MAKSAAPGAPQPRDLPRHIILLADWGKQLAGKVLAADADLIAALDAAQAQYRPATAIERSIAGFIQE
jgi:hypothetical protein